MKKTALYVLLIALLAVSSLHAQLPGDQPAVVRLDPALDSLVSADAKLDLVKNDFGFTEGVVWVDEGKSGYLLLSDMYANVIYKVTPEGKVALYLDLAATRVTTSGAWVCRNRTQTGKMCSS